MSALAEILPYYPAGFGFELLSLAPCNRQVADLCRLAARVVLCQSVPYCTITN
jgi:hypothetical protein